MSVTYGWTLQWGHANMDKLVATGIRKSDPKRTMFCHLQTEQHGKALRSNAWCFSAMILLSKLPPKRAAERHRLLRWSLWLTARQFQGAAAGALLEN
jgi:hypothetical protein